MIEIEALKYLGKYIKFGYCENNSTNVYQGFVQSVIIEHDGKNKICIEHSEDNSEIYEIDEMIEVEFLTSSESLAV